MIKEEQTNKIKNMKFVTPEKLINYYKESTRNKVKSKKGKSSIKANKYTHDKNCENERKSISLNPFPFINEKEEIIKISRGFSLILSEIIKKNKRIPQYYIILHKQKNDIFSLCKKPSISLEEFFKRIIEYTNVEFSTLIISLIYINKVLETGIVLSDYNVYKLVSISILLAIKYNEDKLFNNDFYGKVFGLSLKEVNYLEYSYLKILDFNVYIENKFLKKLFQFIYNKLFVEFSHF